jgi:hypothetical protein
VVNLDDRDIYRISDGEYEKFNTFDDIKIGDVLVFFDDGELVFNDDDKFVFKAIGEPEFRPKDNCKGIRTKDLERDDVPNIEKVINKIIDNEYIKEMIE